MFTAAGSDAMWHGAVSIFTASAVVLPPQPIVVPSSKSSTLPTTGNANEAVWNKRTIQTIDADLSIDGSDFFMAFPLFNKTEQFFSAIQ